MSRITVRLLFVSFVLAMAPTAWAEDRDAAALPRKELDQRIGRAYLDTVRMGAAIFNAGDHAGCYRLYQGALMNVTPLLDHHPALQQRVRKAMQDASHLRSWSDRAFALRAALDEVYDTLTKETASAPPPRMEAPKTLYERLGGEPAIRAVVDDFVARAAANPRVNFTRKGTDVEWEATTENVAQLKKHLVQLVGMVTGGPQKYEGRSMKAVHRGMMISNEEFDALAGDLKASLDKFKVPEGEQQELLAIVASTRADIVEKK